ncbi:MAG: HEAT repeat domain-containing protein [Thermoflexus hugenholtzii]|uniref:BTAD domain-containing putative transcriptional regulator n=1 Tax=Thermoflexus TaxID=1495649 RepID=UPI001C768603|nr:MULTISPECIES: BTAD domain-containing putative transcriptional regulator [Thermoflexus]QWK10948.1 MAG: HEAT repeat domain-containing protein [Thermoflexus hugenholtzii]
MEASRAPAIFRIRPHLVQRVHEGLQQGTVWIAAPPGYGKSTLLRSLELHLPGSRYLGLMPSAIDPDCLREVLASLQGARIRLLDDVHLLADGPEALGVLQEAIARTPERWVVAGRWIPEPLGGGPFPQTWLTEAELAFSVDEVAAALGVDPGTAVQVHRRTRGWPMAIALLAQPDADRPLPERWPEARDRLFEELARSLIRTLPEPLRAFLFRTAIPLWFNGALAAALLEDRSDLLPQLPGLLQEVQRRRLFLESAGSPDRWRYHELFREFLLRHIPEPLPPLFTRAVAWFEKQGDLEMAIEHALAGGLDAEAVRLLRALPDAFIWDRGRRRTFRRWVMALPEPARREAPDLMLRLGKELHRGGYWEEGRALLREVLAWAEQRGDPALRDQASLMLASVLYIEGRFGESLAWSMQGLGQARSPALRMRLLKTAADACTGLGRLSEARRLYQEAMALAEALGDPHYPAFLRHNQAVGVEIPAGRFEAARALLSANAPYYTERPAQRITHQMGWALLAVETGAWAELEGILREIEALAHEVEEGQASNDFWFWWCRAMGAIGQKRWDAAAQALARAGDLAHGHPERMGALAQAQAWQARRQGRPEEALRIAEQALPRLEGAPLVRGLVALERDLAAWALGQAESHPAVGALIAARAGAAFPRLRALRALQAYAAGDPRWRRHLHAALRQIRREDWLSARDPELGTALWLLCLQEGIHEAEAIRALGRLRPLSELGALLRHPREGVRHAAAQALAAAGEEAAMPLLQDALRRERHAQVRQAIAAALEALESLPPPPLEIRLLGRFEVRRGGQLLPDSAWPRPAVARLLQYFALHRRQWLTRERILEDLWPKRDPEEAEEIFRRLFSWLHQVLEPAVRPKGPFRYFASAGESLRFDPQDVVKVDVEQMETEIRRALAARPMNRGTWAALAARLEEWPLLLPGVPYDAWLIPHQERWRSLRTEAAQALAEDALVLQEPVEAIRWAERAIEEAPWLEEGYQVLMRAWSRLGQRARALRVYEEAVETLRRELQVPPAPLTRWLAERLRRGEPI